jgi:arylsulfatase
MKLWRSEDLVSWESLGTPYTLKDGIWATEKPERFETTPQSEWRLWAPELHLINGKWFIVHTSPSPVNGANLSVTAGDTFEGPFANPMGADIQRRHDPSLFVDEGKVWLLWGNTQIALLKDDFSGIIGEPVDIGPSDHRIGHEGCLMKKIGEKYVLFGTGWSTDKGRHGTYNLYYCTAHKSTGPFGPRKFAGRFLGHGTPFIDKQGRWWCTAFYNANLPPITAEEIKTTDCSTTAYTINEQGVTLVPLDVRVLDDGEIYIRAADPDYASPGAEEVQKF